MKYTEINLTKKAISTGWTGELSIKPEVLEKINKMAWFRRPRPGKPVVRISDVETLELGEYISIDLIVGDTTLVNDLDKRWDEGRLEFYLTTTR